MALIRYLVFTALIQRLKVTLLLRLFSLPALISLFCLLLVVLLFATALLSTASLIYFCLPLLLLLRGRSSGSLLLLDVLLAICCSLSVFAAAFVLLFPFCCLL